MRSLVPPGVASSPNPSHQPLPTSAAAAGHAGPQAIGLGLSLVPPGAASSPNPSLQPPPTSAAAAGHARPQAIGLALAEAEAEASHLAAKAETGYLDYKAVYTERCRREGRSLPWRPLFVQKSREKPDVSSYGLFDSSSEDESIIASSQMLSDSTNDGSSSTFPSSCEKIVAGAADAACAPATPYPDVSSSDEYSGYSSEESISTSPRTVPRNTTDGSLKSASSLGSDILIQSYMNCYQVFYIRMDRRGLFLTYPDVGGPFQSVDEAIHATKNFFDELWCEDECKECDEFSHVDGVMNHRKYYLRGPPKRTSSPSSMTAYDEKQYLLKALLDQYNDDNNLVGDCAHELEEILGKQLIYENHRWYYHFNFTTKQKEDDDNTSNTKKLFFAEVSHMQGEKAWEVNCCCMIDLQPNGVVCQGCINNGSPYMMHPSNPDAYAGGRLNGYLPFGCELSGSDDEEEEEDREYVCDDDDDDDDEEEKEEEEDEDDDEKIRPWLRSGVWPINRNAFLV